MPKALEQALMRKAHAQHMSPERTRRFVYGTMRKKGWKPKRERK